MVAKVNLRLANIRETFSRELYDITHLKKSSFAVKILHSAIGKFPEKFSNEDIRGFEKTFQTLFNTVQELPEEKKDLLTKRKFFTILIP
jgi:hypothetical protein